jgi:hypothetical protein
MKLDRDLVRRMEEPSTPGQAARTTLVSARHVTAAPPRIYAAQGKAAMLLFAPRKSGAARRLSLFARRSVTRAACPGVKAFSAKSAQCD